jgi:2-methylisocitrate lyase-like PEP mutase family enzyme
MTNPVQSAKAVRFQQLHQGNGCFVIPNPWDVGSARLLAGLGFKALATTSAGLALTLGRPDKQVARDALMAHLAALSAATDLPISADLEAGFGDTPNAVAQTIWLAAEAGVVGGSIEDASGDQGAPLYERAHAVERIRAAVEAARSLPFPFMLTARAENHVVGRPDLADTIGRLQAYQEAGADVLYAPGLSRREDIATLLREVDRPVNVLLGVPGLTLDVAALAAMGVRRVSVGGSLARAAYGEFMRAATELRDHGTAVYTQAALSGRDLNRWFGDDAPPSPQTNDPGP